MKSSNLKTMYAQLKLPKSTPAVKSKLLQVRRRKQMLALKSTKPKKAVKTTEEATTETAKPTKAEKPTKPAAEPKK